MPAQPGRAAKRTAVPIVPGGRTSEHPAPPQRRPPGGKVSTARRTAGCADRLRLNTHEVEATGPAREERVIHHRPYDE